MMPVMTIIKFPISIAAVCNVGLQKISTVTVKARKIATPPMSGISFLCMRRLSFGISVTPNLNAMVRTTGVEEMCIRDSSKIGPEAASEIAKRIEGD